MSIQLIDIKKKAEILHQDIEIGDIQQGFIRDHEGRIFFVWKQGPAPVRHIVLEDGSIVSSSTDFPIPHERVIAVDPKNLGITEIKFAEKKKKEGAWP
ncbi:MAG TPA: hypothetical protein VGO63_03970 [Candidatus Paceibacterota bacterium]|nr:hypothetical protein [Candidatus Paceibacterota bacterium]